MLQRCLCLCCFSMKVVHLFLVQILSNTSLRIRVLQLQVFPEITTVLGINATLVCTQAWIGSLQHDIITILSSLLFLVIPRSQPWKKHLLSPHTSYHTSYTTHTYSSLSSHTFLSDLLSNFTQIQKKLCTAHKKCTYPSNRLARAGCFCKG